MTDEKADFDNLLKSPGWLRVLDRARQDWKDGYPAKIKLAISEALTKGADVAAAVQMVDYASDEVNRLLSWPQERMKQLTRADPVETFSRGGYDTQTPR